MNSFKTWSIHQAAQFIKLHDPGLLVVDPIYIYTHAKQKFINNKLEVQFMAPLISPWISLFMSPELLNAQGIITSLLQYEKDDPLSQLCPLMESVKGSLFLNDQSPKLRKQLYLHESSLNMLSRQHPTINIIELVEGKVQKVLYCMDFYEGTNLSTSKTLGLTWSLWLYKRLTKSRNIPYAFQNHLH